MLNGILWVLRTGAPWRDVPERYGKWTTIYSRFQRWRKAGIRDRVLAGLQSAPAAENKIGWRMHFIDSTIVRAHRHAAGAKKSSADEEALGRSRGGLSTKIHLRCDETGRLMRFLLTPGQAGDIQRAEPLLTGGVIRQPSGQRRSRPERVVGDKGYSSRAFRAYLRGRRIGVTIARRANERRAGVFDKEAYRRGTSWSGSSIV